MAHREANQEIRGSQIVLRVTTTLLALVSIFAYPAELSAERPNVIVIIADDQGWGDLSLRGNRNLQTPSLDRLASQGASFERFYVQPVCSPTRAEFLTGRYAPAVGVRGVTAGEERLDPSVPTIADAFRSAGYRTAALGKWHNGTQPPYHPLCRGFDSYYGFTSGHWGHYFNPMLDRNGQITRGDGYLPDDLTDEAIKLLSQTNNEPLFLLLAYNTPHSPMQVPDRLWERHADQELLQRSTLDQREDVQHTRAALAMVENLDWNVGRLLGQLDESQLSEKTIVVYFSDNGPNGHRYTAGLRGVKGSTDEGGVRSPLFIRWPNEIAPQQHFDWPAAAIDLAPTLCELAGIENRSTKTETNISLAPLLRNNRQKDSNGLIKKLRERTLFSHWAGRVAARRGTLLLDDKNRLYDLATDPGQTKDIAASRPRELTELKQAVAAWKMEVGINRPAEPRPFTVGHPSLAMTQLPVRDATSRGNIKRSNRYFNSTYFTNWRSTEDAIVWDVDVVQGGRFAATVYYACRAEDVGATIELTFADASLTAEIIEAHDPPLLGAAEDRLPRQEGYEKAFKSMRLGEIELTAGRGELSLGAVEIPGESVMEVRLLVLERVE